MEYELKSVSSKKNPYTNEDEIYGLDVTIRTKIVNQIYDGFENLDLAFCPIEKTDTIYFQKVDDWTNNYLSLFNSKIENSVLSFDYKYSVGIDFLTSGKRKETTVSVILSDPKAVITNANSITINNKTRWYEKQWLWAIAGFGVGVLVIK